MMEESKTVYFITKDGEPVMFCQPRENDREISYPDINQLLDMILDATELVHGSDKLHNFFRMGTSECARFMEALHYSPPRKITLNIKKVEEHPEFLAELPEETKKCVNLRGYELDMANLLTIMDKTDSFSCDTIRFTKSQAKQIMAFDNLNCLNITIKEPMDIDEFKKYMDEWKSGHRDIEHWTIYIQMSNIRSIEKVVDRAGLRLKLRKDSIKYELTVGPTPPPKASTSP